jgi:hypothetical protein
LEIDFPLTLWEERTSPIEIEISQVSCSDIGDQPVSSIPSTLPSSNYTDKFENKSKVASNHEEQNKSTTEVFCLEWLTPRPTHQ